MDMAPTQVMMDAVMNPWEKPSICTRFSTASPRPLSRSSIRSSSPARHPSTRLTSSSRPPLSLMPPSGIHCKHRGDHTVEADQSHCQSLNPGQAFLHPMRNPLLCQHSQYCTGYNRSHIDPCSCHSSVSSPVCDCSSRSLRSTCLSLSVSGAVRSRSGRFRKVFSSDFSRRHWSILAWLPFWSTSGTSRPCHTGGRV